MKQAFYARLILVVLFGVFGMRAGVGPGTPVKPFLANGDDKNIYDVTVATALAASMEADRVLQGDSSSNPITINASGTYGLTENLTGTTIVIDADDVVLDLGCHTIKCTLTASNAITVNAGKKRIKIHNGMIYNTAGPGTGSGVLVQAGSSNVQVEYINTFSFGVGIKLNGSDGSEVTGCSITACDMVLNTTGVQLYYADKTAVKECLAIENTQAGFELLHSESNCLLDCQALETLGNASIVAGFTSEDGYGNLFQRCVSERTATTAVAFCNTVYGFLLTGTEENTKIIECVSNGTDASLTGSATVSYRIAFSPILLNTSDLLAVVDAFDVGAGALSVAWSPDGKYIAVGDDANDLQVFLFDGTSLARIDSDTTPVGLVDSVAWSPDGKYIATGDRGDFVSTWSFDGSNLFLIDSDITPGEDVKSVAWSPDGKYIVTGDDGDFVRVWKFDSSNLTLIDSDSTPANDVDSVAWSPDGKYIVSCDAGSVLRVWSFDGKAINEIDNHSTTPLANPRSATWSPCGGYIAFGSSSGALINVVSFDGTTITHIGSGTPGGTAQSVSWSPGGKYIVSGDGGNDVTVFSFDGITLTLIKQDSTASNIVMWVDWSSSGKYIASVDNAQFLRVYDAMAAPQNCLVDDCQVCDALASGLFFGTGIMGGDRSFFTQNICCNNGVNFTFGIPNVYFGRNNSQQPFDNISMPLGQ